jgi:hypothetical protein
MSKGEDYIDRTGRDVEIRAAEHRRPSAKIKREIDTRNIIEGLSEDGAKMLEQLVMENLELVKKSTKSNQKFGISESNALYEDFKKILGRFRK